MGFERISSLYKRLNIEGSEERDWLLDVSVLSQISKKVVDFILSKPIQQTLVAGRSLRGLDRLSGLSLHLLEDGQAVDEGMSLLHY